MAPVTMAPKSFYVAIVESDVAEAWRQAGWSQALALDHGATDLAAKALYLTSPEPCSFTLSSLSVFSFSTP
jgi:hypothetical protein